MKVRENAVLQVASVELFPGEIHVVEMNARCVEPHDFVMSFDISAYLAVKFLQFRVVIEAEAVPFCKFAVLVK